MSYDERYIELTTEIRELREAIQRLADDIRRLRVEVIHKPEANEVLMQRQCLYCGHVFNVGPGSGRRRDSKFCCNIHRITWHSLNRTHPMKPAETPENLDI